MNHKNTITPMLLLAAIVIAVVTIPVEQQHMQIARAATETNGSLP